jgi:alpha-glucoside transport system substrate-binding protein
MAFIPKKIGGLSDRMRKMMKKNGWGFIAILFLFAVAVSACTPEDPPVELAAQELKVLPQEPVEEQQSAKADVVVEGIDCKGAQPGDELYMLYQWSGQEEERLQQILRPLVLACGIELAPESTRDQNMLDTRVEAGTPPDVAFWNAAQLVQYQDILAPMTDLEVNEGNYREFFKDPGVVKGRWLGLPIKVDVKSIIWYSPDVFNAKGYSVPTTWAELEALVDEMVENGDVPWSMGFESDDATGWAGTDFIQDILLVKQGPDFVNGIISGNVPYDSPGVFEAYEIYGAWAKDPLYSVSGAEGTLSTDFVDAIFQVFEDPPTAMMVKQSGFASGEIQTKFDDLAYGTGYDFFPVPDLQGLQGGVDWMMVFSDSPAVRALVSYLSSDLGGIHWAQAGFDNTPNLAGTGNYAREDLNKRGDMLATTTGFTPDIGDNILGFGPAEFDAITDFIMGADLREVLDRLAAIQASALK